MITYREDLEAARFQIAHLRGELVEKDETIARLRAPPPPPCPPAPPAAPSPARETSESSTSHDAVPPVSVPDPMWIYAWPVVPLIVLVVVYVAIYGASAPSEPWSLSIASAGAAAGFMGIRSALQAHAGGTSSVGQRLLTIVAVLAAAPLGIALCAVALPVVGIVISVGSLLVGAYHVLGELRDWIAGR